MVYGIPPHLDGDAIARKLAAMQGRNSTVPGDTDGTEPEGEPPFDILVDGDRSRGLPVGVPYGLPPEEHTFDSMRVRPSPVREFRVRCICGASTTAKKATIARSWMDVHHGQCPGVTGGHDVCRFRVVEVLGEPERD